MVVDVCTDIRPSGVEHRWGSALVVAVLGVVFAGVATATSWTVLADRRSFDLPLRVLGLVAVVAGLVVWGRGRRVELGQLIMAIAVGSFVRDFRASENGTLFVLGFWFSFLWVAIVAHAAVAWPTGRLAGRSARALVAAFYLMAVGPQVARYFVDRPQPGWLSGHPPNTLWANIASGLAVVMALAVAAYTARRWVTAPRLERRASEPVWVVFIVLAVTSAAASIASIVGVPDGQIELVPSALAVAMLAPSGWVYARMRAQIAEIRASRLRVQTVGFEERRRIQADLHNSAQQSLWTVMLHLEQALGSLTAPARDIAAAEVELRTAHVQLGETFQSLRDLVQGIYPTALKKEGLHAALEGLADRSAVPLVLHVPPERWDKEIELTAYFIVTEAVGNSIRHAKATRIAVNVCNEADDLVIEVVDDGQGGAVPPERGGLYHLQDLASTIGGSLALVSTPTAGTRVTVRLRKEGTHAGRPGRGSQG